MSVVKHIPVDMDASRVCDAIARIGYSPAAALMDIVDNSITAGARRVVIEILTDPEKTHAAKNNVIAYRVIDNGKGMGDGEILNALKLGSSSDYEKDSLSKYGMGLKSAGFSLGSRIQLVSKKNGAYSSVNYVDKDEISEIGKYVVCRERLGKDARRECEDLLWLSRSGTIVTITGSHRTNHDSARNTIEKLHERLRVVYYQFLGKSQDPLTITIKCTGKDDLPVTPFDILFSDIAQEGFDEDTYDCKTPCRVFREAIPLTGEQEEKPMSLEVVIFPKDSMSTHPSFSDEERQLVKSYQVKRVNKGFFIYRNSRLIRWGEDLNGLVGKDELGFRARMVINTSHDDVLHVDVSKQRLAIPEDIEQQIRTLMRVPLRQAKAAFTECSERLKSLESEGSGFNQKNQDLVEEDPEEAPVDSGKEVKRRKDRLRIKSEEVLKEEEADTQKEPQAVDQIPVFQKVRYSEKVSSFSVWEAGFSAVDGTFVRINKNHSFYSTVLATMDNADRARQAIEAILWVCAASENLTYRNLTDVDEQTITKVLTRFKKVFASNLDSWCGSNQDIYDD